MFVSRRIWIDSLLSGLVALAVALLVIAQEGARLRPWGYAAQAGTALAASGVLLGLAGLWKLTALILLEPVLLRA